jgi:hypothetical protein
VEQGGAWWEKKNEKKEGNVIGEVFNTGPEKKKIKKIPGFVH